MHRLAPPWACGVAALLVGLLDITTVAAAPLTPELQKQVREATFEVVMKKPEKDTLTYEKPLPLELIPFQERNDKYRSVGTAFAIAPNTFVTAAHVIGLGVASQFGPPAIRDGENRVYAIDRVLKYSNHEDFVVFTVIGAPAVTPLATNTAAAIDDPVFAVGNALGEGIVIRDGLLTSLTPEAQDGRWKWLRFSAAASPGNSGGPLLDSQGRVIGLVARKSPNENLNFALPIDRVLDATDKTGVFETRESFGITKVLRGTIVADFKETFPLPAPFPQFAQDVRAAILKYFTTQYAKLVAAESASIFPQGKSAKLLAEPYTDPEPTVIAQEDDDTWEAKPCTPATVTELSGDGRVWHCAGGPGGMLFRLQYPGYAADDHRYHDSKEFMDLMLQGLAVPRVVGTQNVRITSLGPAHSDNVIRDHFGRAWQLRSYAIGYADIYLMTLALPTPDGYVGIASMVPSGLEDIQAEGLKFLADFIYSSYSGSLPQWQAFLQRKDLRPAVFDHVRLQFDLGKAVRFDSPRLQFDSSGLAVAGAQSELKLRMAFMMDHGKLTWDIGGLVLKPDRDRKAFVAAFRQPRPGQDAGHELRERWEHMSHGDGEFAGTVQHDNDLTDFWVRTVGRGAGFSDADATRPQYELLYNLDRALLPRETEEIKSKLAGSFHITE